MEAANLPIVTNLVVGDRIIIVMHKTHHLDRGYVRWIQAAKDDNPSVYGIELDLPKGSGTGNKYFTTPENHAVLMKENYLRKMVSETFDEKALLKVLKKEADLKKSQAQAAPEKPAETTPTPKATLTKAPTENIIAEPKAATQKPETQGTPAPVKLTSTGGDSDAKFKDMEESYKAMLSKKEKEIITLKSKVRSLEETLSKEKDKASKSSENDNLERQFQAMEVKFSNMSIEYESLKQELENTKVQLEESSIRVQELEYDKEIMLLQADLASEEGGEGETDVVELKKNYGYLKIAFSRLEENLSNDKAKYEKKIEELEAKSKNFDVANSDQVKKLLKEKEQAYNDLKSRLEDVGDSDKYIESLTDQILNKDNALVQLNMEVQELKQTISMNDDLIEEYEEMNGLLNGEIDMANSEIAALKEKLEIATEQKKEDDSIIGRYRDKIKIIQGEIDIIKSQNSESKEQDKVSKIDKLIKNYTVCLQEKRNAVKKVIQSEFKEIKEAKQNLKWNIVIKSIPPKFVNELDSPPIEKFFIVLELIKKIELILNQLKSNYLLSSIVIEDNLDIVGFILTAGSVLLNLRRSLEYVFDYGFNLDKFDDLKNLTRSPLFSILISVEMILDRLITEIREDTFNVKLSLKMLEENSVKIHEGIFEYTRELKEVRNKESIDLRYFTKSIELNYLVACGYAENKKQAVEALKANCSKISAIAQNVSIDKSWIKEQEEVVRQKSVKDESTMDSSNLSLKTEGETEQVRLFQVDRIEPYYELLQKSVLTIQSGEDPSATLAGIEEATNKFILYNNKKIKRSDDEPEFPVRLVSECGPWMDNISFVKRKLEKFEEIQAENEEKGIKIEELNKKNLEAEIKIENNAKVKATMENRIKDLEFKNQSIPMIENEKNRLQEQNKICVNEIEKLKKSMGNMEEKAKLGGNSEKETKSAGRQLWANFKKMQDAERKDGAKIANPFARGLLLIAKEANKEESVSNRTQAAYERIIENLNAQILTRDQEELFDNVKMVKEMPYFYKLYEKEKKKVIYGDSMETAGKNALSQLNSISQQLKKKVVAKRVIDLTKSNETDPIKRLQEFSKQIVESEKSIENEKERAICLMEEFQSKWLCHYSNVSNKSILYSKLLTENSTVAGGQKLIGRVKLEKLSEEATKQSNDSNNRVLVRKNDLKLVKAFKL